MRVIKLYEGALCFTVPIFKIDFYERVILLYLFYKPIIKWKI